MRCISSFHCRWVARLVALFCLPLTAAVAEQHNQPPEGFVALFNGRDFENWTGSRTRDLREILALSPPERAEWDEKMRQGIERHWRVESGELVNDGNQPYLATPQHYSDIEMWVDWKIGPGGDSGIYLRGCPQVQIWDPTDVRIHRHGADKGSGGLWNNKQHERFPSELADRPIGEWNRMFIRMVGPYVTVKLNGTKVVDNVVMENYHDREIPIFKRGPIYLQTHGSEIRFRNIFLREIPPDEANRHLAEIGGGEVGFEPLFNGRDLAGWMGAVDDHEVVDGAIVCKPGRQGNLLTEQTFDNFVVRVEFKLPPGGNNGLAIRAPAGGRASYDGIEVQVLDDTAPRYADIQDYRRHGSLYGLAAATPGYLRPLGEWNYQQVTVDGEHIRVELNGYEILDVNLDDVRHDPVDGKDHPGAFRTSGHFGFCAHRDPVAFRNIRIKRLPAE